MKVIKVCIGSACHLKGSYDVIAELKNLIKNNSLESKLELQAAFCLGQCMKAVSVLRWDGKLFSMSRDNVCEVFDKEFKYGLED